MENGTGEELPPSVQYVRLLFCDNAGIRRCRVIPARRLDEIFAGGVGLTVANAAMPAWGDVTAPGSGFGPIGDVRLLPAKDAPIRQLPWNRRHAIAICDMHETSEAGEPWAACPRSALKRVLAAAEAQHGLTFSIGHESEFVLLQQPARPQGVLPPGINNALYCSSGAYDAAAPVMDDIAEAIEGLGMVVEQLHAESAHGQFEVVTRYTSALKAADELLLTREAIRAVARKHGHVVTFLPKLSTLQAGSGGHLHLSLWKDGKNLLDGWQAGGGGTAELFMAGILAHLPGLLAFTVPSPLSFERMRPGCWSSAFQCWGVSNKEAPLRVCGTPTGVATNVEFKALDATANPHIAQAAIIVAGLLGIKEGRSLPPALSVDPGTLSGKQLSQAGVKPLPASLGEALECLAKDTAFLGALREGLSDELVTSFLAVRRSELAWCAGLEKESSGTEDYIVRVASQLYDRY